MSFRSGEKGKKNRHAETTKNTALHAQSLTRPLKRYVPNKKVVFWATRGYVKLRGEGYVCMCMCECVGDNTTILLLNKYLIY